MIKNKHANLHIRPFFVFITLENKRTVLFIMNLGMCIV